MLSEGLLLMARINTDKWRLLICAYLCNLWPVYLWPFKFATDCTD